MQSVSAKTTECIALILSGNEHRHFWSQVVAGAEKAADELEVILYSRGIINDNDIWAQKIIFHHYVDDYGCKGIVIAPADAGLNEDVADSKRKGIYTVYIDRDTGGERIASIATDNQAAGVFAAKKMAEEIGENGKVVLFRLKKGVASTDAREEGFIQEAERMGLNIVSAPYIGTRTGDARGNAKRILNQINDIDGIFTPNDTTTIGTLLALEGIEKHKKHHTYRV